MDAVNLETGSHISTNRESFHDDDMEILIFVGIDEHPSGAFHRSLSFSIGWWFGPKDAQFKVGVSV